MATTEIDTIYRICGPDQHFVMSLVNISSTCASIQTESHLPYQKKKKDIKGQPFSDVWVQSVSDYLLDSKAVLDGMKESLDSLRQVCKNTDVT